MKLFISGTYVSDISQLWQGTPISNYYHIINLAKKAEIHFPAREEKEVAENIRFIPLNPWGFEENRKRMQDHNYDGILILEPKFQDFAILRELSDSPIILRMHGIKSARFIRETNILACYSLLQEYDAIAPVSEWAAEYFSQFIDDKRCMHPIPNGVDLDFFRPMDKAEAKMRIAQLVGDDRVTKYPVVGFLSRFQPEKGSIFFLEASRRIKDVIFLVAGPVVGDYSDLLGENVILAGPQTRANLPLFYNSFDVYCFPSVVDSESFGMTVLEAMACGVVPIVTDFDGPPEVIGEAGIKIQTTEYDRGICGLVAYPSVEDMVEKIRFLLEDEKERNRLSKLARQRSMKYSWDEVAQQIITLFSNLREKKAALSSKRKTHSYTIRFVEELDMKNGSKMTSGALFNISQGRTGSLSKPPYSSFYLEFEEALCLTLLRQHRRNEVKGILREITDSMEKVQEIFEKVDRFLISIC